MRTIDENERIEKIRRMSISPNKDKELKERLGIALTFPDAYETVKDTTNFVWIEKQVVKGHLNIIAYSLPLDIDLKKIEERIPKIRDSIGKIFIPGRIPGSYMITERAYLPYYYKTKVNRLDAILTKGTWEVQNDFMAGPYVNYIINDTINKRKIVIEGFSFAPSESKRNYMFELNTIITTLKFVNKNSYSLESSSSSSLVAFLNSLIPLRRPLISSGIFLPPNNKRTTITIKMTRTILLLLIAHLLS